MLGSLLNRSSEHAAAEAPDSAPNSPGPVHFMDVVFIFKKAYEVSNRETFTPQTLPDILQAMVEQMSGGQDTVPRSSVLQFIRNTCSGAHMAVPSESQVTRLFADIDLANREQVTKQELLGAMSGFRWFVV